jgi:Protein of unknown function (DUF3558)
MLALCCVIAACGSEGSPNNSDAPGATSSGPPADTPSAASIDACSLLVPEDISALLGTTVEGEPTSTDPDAPACLWENPENYESIALEIGGPGTAVNDTLPPPELGFPEVGTTGPDGMRFLGNGQVEFPAGGRNNSVQVAVLSMSGDEANNAAVELARKIGPQIPE